MWKARQLVPARGQINVIWGETSDGGGFLTDKMLDALESPQLLVSHEDCTIWSAKT